MRRIEIERWEHATDGTGPCARGEFWSRDIYEIFEIEGVDTDCPGFEAGMLSAFRSPFEWSYDSIRQLMQAGYRLMRYVVHEEETNPGKAQVAFYRETALEWRDITPE